MPSIGHYASIWLGNPALLTFLTILAVAPWPLGSNRDYLWPAIFVPLYGLTMLTLWQRDGRQLPTGIVIALVILVAWLGVQAWGIPGWLPPISIDPELTQRDLLLTMGYACVFYLTLQLINNDRALGQLMIVLLLGASLQMAAGLWQVFQLHYPSASGSFASPNHFTAFLYLSLLPAGAWLLARGTARILLVVLGLAAAFSLILSESRMGVAVVVSAALAVFVYSLFLSRHLRPVAATTLTFSGIALALGIIAWVSSQGIMEEVETRIPINQASLAIIADHGVLGTGAGTFPIVFPQYRTSQIFDQVTFAENDYFEFVIELGIPGALALLLLSVLCVHQQYRLVAEHGGSQTNNISKGCLAATIAILLHSLTDFNLQIPANAMLVVVVLALPFTAALSDSHQPAGGTD